MRTSALLSRGITGFLLVLAFGLAVYRASVQPIAHDEALTYNWFLDGGAVKVLNFNSNNHILFTIIAKFFVKIFGVSELSLRAPSVIGTAFYLIATFALCRRLFGDSIWLPFSLTMLCLNPQILDFMAAARGYILGLAFLSAAMCFLVRAADRGVFNAESKECRLESAAASVFFAFSVASNLTNLFPAAGLLLFFSAIVLPAAIRLAQPGDRRLYAFARYAIVPGVLTGCGILWPYLIQARPALFYMRPQSASDAIRDIFTASLLYKWTDDIYAPSLGAVPPILHSWQERVSDLGLYLLLPLLLCFLVFGLIFISRVASQPRRNQTTRCQLFGGAAIACVALPFMLHVVVKLNYPFSRTSLYFIPLLTISGLLIGRELSFRLPRYRLRTAGLVIAAAVVFDYAMSLNTRYFRYNAYDIISRDLFLTISRDAASRGLTKVRVCGTWWYASEIDFYRHRYHAEWMMPVDLIGLSCARQANNSSILADYDYFVFIPAADPELVDTRLRTIFQDRTTGATIVAVHKQQM